MATPIVSQSVCSSVVPAGSPPKPHVSVYEIITSQILAELERGEVPWRKPWRTLPPANLITKKPYRGINVFLLGFAGYGSQYWLTFNQARQLGGNVRRGEHGTKIVFWKFDTRETETADGEIEERKFAILRYFTVFNLEDSLPSGSCDQSWVKCRKSVCTDVIAVTNVRPNTLGWTEVLA